MPFYIIDNETNVTNCVTGDIRLVGGSTQYEGRIELCVNNVWGAVCGWRYWGRADSDVVCRQLGHMGLGKCLLFTFISILTHKFSSFHFLFSFSFIIFLSLFLFYALFFTLVLL